MLSQPLRSFLRRLGVRGGRRRRLSQSWGRSGRRVSAAWRPENFRSAAEVLEDRLYLNAAPVIAAPSQNVVGLNGELGFGSGSITITDTAASGTSDSLSLSVSKGTLTLGSTTGVTFTFGSNGSSSMIVSGSLANLNAAVTGLEYSPNSNYFGADSLQLSVTNSLDNLTGSASDSITVLSVPPPSISAPSNWYASLDNLGGVFSAPVSITDASASGTSDSLTLSVTEGSLTLGSTAGLNFISGANNSPSMTVNGTLANLNGALNGLKYSPNTDYVGTDTMQLSVVDANNGTSSTVAIPVTVFDSGPEVELLNGPQTYALSEDGFNYPIVFAFRLFDGSAEGNSDSLTFTATNGTITFGGLSPSDFDLTVTAGAVGSSSITLNGSLVELNELVGESIKYTPNPGYTGPDSLQLTLENPANGLAESNGVNINVIPGAFVYAAPGPTVAEYGSYTFAAGAIGVIDDAAVGSSDSLTLSIGQGSLTLGSTAGLTFTAGSNDSNSMTVTGTLAELNAAVDGLVFSSSSNYLGSEDLHISVSDSGNNTASRTVVPINVYQPPTLTAPLGLSLNENSSYSFSGGSIAIGGVSDPSLSLSVSEGTLTLASTSGLTFSSGANASSSMTVVGSPQDVNAALNGLIYTPNALYSGSDSLQLLVTDTDDGLTASAAVPLTVNAPPGVTAPAAATVLAGGSLTLSPGSISVTDAAASGTSDSLSLAVVDGDLTLGSTAGLTFSTGSSGSSSMTVTGTLSNLNAALSGLVYTPATGYSGNDSLQVSIVDANDGQTGSGAVAITDDAPPSMSFGYPTGQPKIDVTENSGAYLNAVLTDAGATATSDSLTVSVTNGIIRFQSTTGLTFTSGANDSSSMTVSGTLANLNAGLHDLEYTPNLVFVGADAAQFTLVDSGENLSASLTAPIEVSVPPVVGAPATSLTVMNNSSYTFAAGSIGFTDINASGTSDSLLLETISGATLTLGSINGLTFSSGSNASSSMIVRGTLANLNAAVNGLVYTPNSNYTGSDTLVLVLQNSINAGAGSSNIIFNVLAAGGPSLTAPVSATVNLDASLVFTGANAIGVSDPGAAGNSDSLTLLVEDGTLTLGSISGLTFNNGSNGSYSMTVTGTVANLEAALNGLVVAPIPGYEGPDPLRISVTDAGENLSATALVALAVDPPTVTATATATLNENTSYTAPGTISLTDTNLGSATVDWVTLSATHGTLTLGSTTGLVFGSGSNDSSTMMVNGTPASLNAAINGLVYEPSPGYVGADSLQISVRDWVESLTVSTAVAFSVKGSPTIAVTDAGGTYNGNSYPATGTVAGVSGTPASTLEGVGLAFTYYAASTASGSPLAGAPASAGTYTVVASFAGSAGLLAQDRPDDIHHRPGDSQGRGDRRGRHVYRQPVRSESDGGRSQRDARQRARRCRADDHVLRRHHGDGDASGKCADELRDLHGRGGVRREHGLPRRQRSDDLHNRSGHSRCNDN